MAPRKKTSSTTPAAREGRARPLAIVGIGASARSLSSLQQLLVPFAADCGLTFLVAMSSGEAVRASAVVDALNGHTALQARLATDGDKLEPGRVYVGPDNSRISLIDGHVRVEPTDETPGERGTIDTMLVSLGDENGERAVAVIMAGLASDGVLGVASIKESGGLTIAEEMRASAETGEADDGDTSPRGLVDFVLPVERIAVEVLAYARNLGAYEQPLAQDETAERIRQVAGVLRAKTGHDFHGYKPNTFMRRIQRRMKVCQIHETDRYIELLRGDSDEVQHLFQDLLIGVTQFFRDVAEFELLEKQVIPQIFAGKGADDNVRVWVLGCATGEEAYTIAMLMREHMAGLDVVPHVQVFATDIDGRALALARAGRYPEAIAKDVSPERLARWFVREGGTYVVHKDLREMCIFSAHNVIRDAPFSRVDLVSCRNLLIYLNADLQDRVMPLFHFALKPGGFLFLGPSENVTRHPKLFAALDRKHRIFKRLETAARVLPEFPLTARADTVRTPAERRPGARGPSVPGVARRAERVAERYAPAYVIVDAEYEVMHFSGRTGPFLDPMTGAASFNLLSLIHRDLRLDLRAALHKANSDNAAVKVENLKLSGEGAGRSVTLVVEPVHLEGEDPSYVVIFQDNGAVASALPARAETGALRDEHVQRLEGELRVTKERLQATIEELESTNEELKSSNEEYQSINEELQSANEELETSKEELQSVNEELQTVNGELAHRVNELARSNSDLKNLLESTQIATIFLDNELRVRSFTPAITELFHLLESDIGRPIGHIASQVAYAELQDDVQRVLRTLATCEREVANPDTGSRYFVRVLPYRSVDNFIAGAVLTFLDVSATKRAEEALRRSEARYRLILDSATDYAIIATDLEGRITGWNVGARNIFGWDEEEVLGRPASIIFTSEDAEAGEDRKERAAADSAGRAEHGRWHVRKDGSRLWGVGLMTPMRDGELSGYLKILRDATREHGAEERQRLLLAELQHRVRNILAVVRSLAARSVESSESLEEFASHFDGRLDTMARTHNVLTRSTDVTVDLEELVRDELLSLAARDDEQVAVEGPPVRLRQRAAEVFALALHELATNAVKYGALSKPKGRVSVSWRLLNTSAGPKLSLEWRESGVPVVDASPTRKGFGRTLIEKGLPYELGAVTSLEFARGGVRATIELPLIEKHAAVGAEGLVEGGGYDRQAFG